jgi:hypothetical protein
MSDSYGRGRRISGIIVWCCTLGKAWSHRVVPMASQTTMNVRCRQKRMALTTLGFRWNLEMEERACATFYIHSLAKDKKSVIRAQHGTATFDRLRGRTKIAKEWGDQDTDARELIRSTTSWRAGLYAAEFSPTL